MKKALFLAYYYPPYGGGGVQRTTKYVKYLRQQGWEPVVITIKEEKIPLWDESLLKDVPENQEIHRTDIWGLTLIEKLLKLRAATSRAKAKNAKIRSAEAPSTDPPSAEAPSTDPPGAEAPSTEAPSAETQVMDPRGTNPSQVARRRSPGIKARVNAWIRPLLKNVFLFVYSFLLYPDDKIGWYPFALRKAKERMQKGDIDLIYTTSAPFTAHLIGLSLKKRTGKPWVMDLRDPWAGNKYLIFSNLRKPLDRFVEGRCVRKADRVITVSEPIREDLLKSYPNEPAEKFIVIPNGYDEEDLFPEGREAFRECSKSPQGEKLVFSYTGSFYNEISPRYFLAAMDTLLKEGKLPQEEIRIEFAGQFGAESLQLITAFQNAHPEVIDVSGYVPHLESTRRMLSADILLLFLNPGAGRGVLTGKLFEYLGTRKPVFAMIPEGLASELIQKAHAGIVVPPEDEKRIQTALLEFYAKWKRGQLISTTDPEVAGQYSRKALAKRLSDIFHELV